MQNVTLRIITFCIHHPTASFAHNFTIVLFNCGNLMLLKKMFIVLPMMKTKIVMFNDAINQIAFPALVLISTLLAG